MIGLLDLGLQLEDPEAIPVATILLRNIEVLVLYVVGRRFDLDMSTGAERHALTIRDLQLEFLDEGGLVVVEMTVQSHFFTPKISSSSSMSMSERGAGLAGQTLAMTGFALADVIQLGRQDVAAAGFHAPCTDHREPPPPQAEETKMPPASTPNGLPPAGLVTAWPGRR